MGSSGRAGGGRGAILRGGAGGRRWPTVEVGVGEGLITGFGAIVVESLPGSG